jgi:dynein heavy chain
MIAMVLESVCVLIGEKTDWASVKRAIGEIDFFDRIRVMDPDSVSEAVLRKLKPYVTNPGFEPVTVGNSS